MHAHARVNNYAGYPHLHEKVSEDANATRLEEGTNIAGRSSDSARPTIPDCPRVGANTVHDCTPWRNGVRSRLAHPRRVTIVGTLRGRPVWCLRLAQERRSCLDLRRRRESSNFPGMTRADVRVPERMCPAYPFGGSAALTDSPPTRGSETTTIHPRLISSDIKRESSGKYDTTYPSPSREGFTHDNCPVDGVRRASPNPPICRERWLIWHLRTGMATETLPVRS